MKKQGFMNIIDENTSDNVVNLDTLRKSLASSEPPDENWVKNLPVGTIFLSLPLNAPKDRIVLDVFAVIEHKTMSVCLAQKIPDGRQVDVWFSALAFSRANKLHEVIAYVTFGYDEEPEAPSEPSEEEGSEELENSDGNSSGPIQS